MDKFDLKLHYFLEKKAEKGHLGVSTWLLTQAAWGE